VTEPILFIGSKDIGAMLLRANYELQLPDAA
jgi:hypothetical protein